MYVAAKYDIYICMCVYIYNNIRRLGMVKYIDYEHTIDMIRVSILQSSKKNSVITFFALVIYLLSLLGVLAPILS